MEQIAIAQVRQRLGLTQKALSRLTGVSRQAINRWEAGKNAEAVRLVPFLARLQQLAEHHKVLQESEEIVGPPIRNHSYK